MKSHSSGHDLRKILGQHFRVIDSMRALDIGRGLHKALHHHQAMESIRASVGRELRESLRQIDSISGYW